MRFAAKNGKQWIVYDNAIVEVTGWSHPGPQKLITNNIGRDVTEMFDQRGHSEYAKELCERMTIGHIGDESVQGQLLNKAYSNMSDEEKAIHKRLQDPKVIDITKPLCPQVAKLTNREFMAFVRRPRFMGGKTDVIKLYTDPAQDNASKSYYGQNLQVLIPLVLLEICVSIAWTPGADIFKHLLNFAFYFVILGSCVAWTATEYYFHGIDFHSEESLDLNAEGPGGQKIVRMFMKHLHHHVFMNEKYRVVLHLRTYAFYLPLGMVLLLLLLPVHIAVMLHAGWLTGSLLYDGMHYSFHHGPDIKIGWYQRMKASHMRHHFRDNQVEFGVTVPWWDYILGTTRKASREK